MKKRVCANPIAWYYVMISLRSCDFLGAVLIPFFTDWGHLSQSTIQFLESWFFLWATILDIPTGILADRMKRKYAIAGGLFFSAVGFFLYGMVASLPVFMIAEILIATGMAFISGAEDAWLYGTLGDLGRKHDASTVAGRAASIASCSRMLTAPVGTLIAVYFGLNAPVLFYAIPCCSAAGIMLLLPEPQQRKKYVYVPMIAAGQTAISFIMRSATLRRLAMSVSLVGIAGYFVIWLYQPLLLSVSIPVVYFGIMHTVLSGAQLIVSGSFPMFVRMFGSQERFIRAMALITAVAFVAPVCYPHLFTALLFIVVGGGFGLTRRQAMFGEINKQIPMEREGERATILSAVSFVQRFLIALFNPVIGLLAAFSLRVALGVLAILPFIAFIYSSDTDEQ